MLGDALEVFASGTAHVQTHKHGTKNGAAHDPRLRDLHVVVTSTRLALISHVSHRLRKRNRDRRPPHSDRARYRPRGATSQALHDVTVQVPLAPSSGLTAKGVARRRETTNLYSVVAWCLRNDLHLQDPGPGSLSDTHSSSLHVDASTLHVISGIEVQHRREELIEPRLSIPVTNVSEVSHVSNAFSVQLDARVQRSCCCNHLCNRKS